MADIGPFVEISRIQSEINRLFDNLLELKSSGSEGTGEWLPSADVYETPEELVVKFEVPGVLLKDLTLTINGNNTHKARTELSEGVLKIAFPKVPDKRGEEVPITVKIAERP